MRHQLWTRIEPPGTGKYTTTMIGIRALCEINPNIRRFSDIRKTDIRALKTYLETTATTKKGKSLSISTIARVFIYLRDITDFLIEHYQKLAQKDKRYLKYIPKHNFFKDFRISNIDNMMENTITIPDVVMDALNEHKNELNATYRLMFDIFNWTGLRAKDVELLEAGCVNYDEENDFWYITATQYKSEKAFVKKGLPPKRIIAIPYNIAKRIKIQEDSTQRIREKYGTPYIFIKETSGYGHEFSIIRASNMAKAVNKIIKKHHITDDTGALWRFTTRQSRKTLAVKLISNGATMQEVATALGHLWVETAAAYYAEVERMKVAEMNTEFFYKKFEVLFGEEQLARFNEQERKQLYVEFCLSFRLVELGMCSKHISQGVCNKLECATCNNLCTGPAYLEQWNKMYDEQQNLLNAMLEVYRQNNDSNYENYHEYQRVLRLRDSYKDVIDRITRESEK